jgi:hypothetical protein
VCRSAYQLTSKGYETERLVPAADMINMRVWGVMVIALLLAEDMRIWI